MLLSYFILFYIVYLHILNDNIMPFTIISTFFLKEATTRIRENLRASYLDEFINEKLELSSANTKRHAPRTIYISEYAERKVHI